MPLRAGLAIGLLAAAVGLSGGQDAPPLKGAIQEFVKQREDAKRQAVRDFDTVLTKVRGAKGLTAAARAQRVKEVTDAKKEFEGTGSFPRDDDYTGIELRYWLAVNKAFVPIARVVDEQIEKGTRANDQPAVERGLKLKADLEAQLPGSSGGFRGKTVWRGTLRRAGGAVIPYRLHVGPLGDGGAFDGHVEDNPGVAGNWAYDVAGQTSGLGVSFWMTKSVRGRFGAVKGVGIVSGDRLIAEVNQFYVGDPKPHRAVVVLNRGK